MEQNQVIQRKNTPPTNCREIWLAGGCFWGTQEYLSRAAGVVDTDVGYANGNTPNPTYESVCAHTTGYAEAVHVVYNPDTITLGFLLSLYFESINPTSINRQGGDVGEQYRTGIYYLDSGDRSVIDTAIAALAKRLDKPVAIEVKPLQNYYLAEEYHQEYMKKNPQGYCHIPASLFAYAQHAKEYQKPDQNQLKQQLTPMQYEVTQNNATEPPFHNQYHDHFAPGIYVDITTGQPLFLSTHKFQSGCGWPAFSRPIHQEDLQEIVDTSHGMIRTEVRSKVGDSHLGHVFEDGPAQLGGLRYCINSASLRFVPKEAMQAEGYGQYMQLLE